MSSTCFRFSTYRNCNVEEVAIGIPIVDLSAAETIYLIHP